MRAAAAIAGWLDDWANPIVVKELRQAVRSRFIIAVMNLFLLGQILVLGFSTAAAHGTGQAGLGRDTFTALLAVLHAACLIAVPLYAGVRLAAERSDANVDLLFISTLKPRAIIAGKLFSAMALTALIYSVCAPFMTFTYLLRGIDLPSIFLLLVIGLVASFACAQFALFLAALPANKALRSVLGLAGISALVSIVGPVMSISSDLLRGGAGSRIMRPEALAVFGTWVAGVLFAAGFLFELCVAIITPPSANRALGVRVLLTAGWFVTGAIAWAWSARSSSLAPLLAWQTTMAVTLCGVMLGCVSERDEIGARVRRQIPRGRYARRLAFLFYSGAAGGMAWVCLLLLATAAAVAATSAHTSPVSVRRGFADSEWRLFWSTLSLCLYTFASCMTALVLWRLVLRRWAPRHTVGALGVVLYAAVVFLPIILSIFLKTDGLRYVERDFLPGIPFSGRNYDHVSAHLMLSGVWAAAVALVSVPWFWRQCRAFQPLVQAAPNPVPAPQADPFPRPSETETA